MLFANNEFIEASVIKDLYIEEFKYNFDKTFEYISNNFVPDN
jgi:hypothetical protein